MIAKSRARWFQLRLRSLLAGFTILTVIAGGWVGYQRAEARKQKLAVQKLEKLGAEVYARPNWLHSMLEPGAPGYVVGLALKDPQKVNDANIVPLADLTELVWLDLNGMPITDEGLAHVAGLKNLERLRLDETSITDTGLIHLAGLSKLRVLNLYKTQVTDNGLAHLKDLPIEELFVGQTQITNSTNVR